MVLHCFSTRSKIMHLQRKRNNAPNSKREEQSTSIVYMINDTEFMWKKSIRIARTMYFSSSSFFGGVVVVVIIRMKCRHFIILSLFSPLCICFRFAFLLAVENVHFAQCFNIHQQNFHLSPIQYSCPFLQTLHSMHTSMCRISSALA